MPSSYTGTQDLHYPDHLDASTGRMLTVTPGGTYDIRVAPGRAEGLPVPPGDGRWGPEVPEEAVPAAAAPDPEPAWPPLPGDITADEPADPAPGASPEMPEPQTPESGDAAPDVKE